MRGTTVRGICLCAVSALAGCSSFQQRSLRIDSAAGMYQGVTLTYKVDGGQLSEPLTVARITGNQVTQERLPSSPYPDQSVVRLSIRYPHPDGKSGFALAEMVVETRRPANNQVKKAVWEQWSDSFATVARDLLPGMKMSDDVFEAWSLDISRSDVDRVIQGLSQSGYFANPSKQTLGVELAVRIDNFQAMKQWTREPELDILLERVRQQGRLVSYVHPADLSGPTGTIVYGRNFNEATLVSHEQAGPSLMPAGPPNSAYQLPPQSAAPQPAPQTLPMPSQSAAPTRSRTDLGLPPSNTPRQTPNRALWDRSPFGRPPATVQALPGRTPNAMQAPSSDPRNRRQYPQPYRRGAQPPVPSPKAAAQQVTPQDRGRFAPQQRMPRMPWQRPSSPQAPASPQANMQQPAAPPYAPNGYRQDPRRPTFPRSSSAPAQSPNNGSRLPPRLQRFFKPPASASNGQGELSAGLHDGIPEPPQISTPSAYR
ncbi:MAG TPA: hypothetical protein VFI31_24640 [Pirellulales bacterium]|nr:hypothetical protein [Pirellulales bacterium]